MTILMGSTTGGSFLNVPVLDTLARANGLVGSNWSGDVGGYQRITHEVDVLGGSEIYWRTMPFGARQAVSITLCTVDLHARD